MLIYGISIFSWLLILAFCLIGLIALFARDACAKVVGVAILSFLGLWAFLILSDLLQHEEPISRPHQQTVTRTKCPNCILYLNVRNTVSNAGWTTCPLCQVIVSWTVVDESKNVRKVTELLDGVKPPIRGATPLVWLYFVENFRYNHSKANSNDHVWQSSSHTTRTMKGVCRDSAVALADWLLANGADVRIACGNVTWDSPDGDRHAWVVLHSEGVDYILESTGPNRFSRAKTPPRSAVMHDYLPDAQFDHRQVWAARKTRERIVNYRDMSIWYEVEF